MSRQATNMGRNAFGQWGAYLPSEQFAAALAALGTLSASPDERASSDPAEALRSALAQDGDLVAWQDPLAALPRLPASVDAWTLATAWQEATTPRLPERVRLAVDPGGWTERGPDLWWVIDQLNRATGAQALVRLAPRSTTEAATRAHWPLRVGFLAGLASEVIRAEFTDIRDRLDWLRQVTEVAPLGSDAAADLLLGVGDLRRGLSAALRLEVRAPFMLLTLPPVERWRHVQPLLEALRSETKAEGVGFVAAAPLTDWLVGFVEHIAHDEPFDVAFHHRPDARAVLLASTSLATLRLSDVLQTLAGDMATAAQPDRAVTLNPVVRELLKAEGPVRLGQAAELLTGGAANLGWDHESGAASGLAELESNVRPVLEDSAEARWLQAQVSDVDGTPRDVLVQGQVHAVHVRVAPGEAGWLALDTPFPEEDLPRQHKPHRLTVVLSEPSLLDAPQVGEIVLPHAGASSTCRFHLPVGTDTAALDARVAVLHGNRVLQSGVLSATVGEPGTLRFAADVVVRLRTDDLAERRRFDAALVLNHSGDGSPRALTTAGAAASLVDLSGDDITTAVKDIRQRLEDIVEDPGEFAALEDRANLDLLVFLANKGRALRDTLVHDYLGAQLAGAQRMQIVAARPDSYFPLEFCYELPAPVEGATMCPAGRDALAEDFATTRTCPAAQHTSEHVCPLGFWAFNRVIERHLYDPQAADRPDRGWLLRNEASASRHRIRLSGTTLLAASERVDGFAAGTIKQLQDALFEITGGQAEFPSTWSDWLDAVAAREPSLLVLLPHTVYSDALGVYSLEIGEGDRLASTQIDRGHLSARADGRAAVLLLGCDTAGGDVTYEHFPARFRHTGAQIIVATLTKVLGRHAAPVAERLVRALLTHPAGAEVTVGELMVGLRRHFLREGMPAVLALTVYGDADWVLEPA